MTFVLNTPSEFSSLSGTNDSHHPKDVNRIPKIIRICSKNITNNRKVHIKDLIWCFLSFQFDSPIGSAQADINWYSCVELSVHWSIGQANAPLNCIISAATSREKIAIFLKTGRVNELSFGLFPKFNARKRAGPNPTQFVRTIACAFKIISKRFVGQ